MNLWFFLRITAAALIALSSSCCAESQPDFSRDPGDDALARARNLTLPEAYILGGEEAETEHADWWQEHAALLREAWEEWEASIRLPHLLPASRLVAEPLRRAVEQVWQDPMAFEQQYRQEHWIEQAPGIYTAQLFSPEAIQDIRAHFDAAASSHIPRRRPNHLNREGLLLIPPDQGKGVNGAVHLTEFEQFYQELIDTYLRPTARALFPEYAGSDEDDAESYTYTIRYSSDLDVELKEHDDNSLYTFSINLNLLPHETYEGSDLEIVVNNQTDDGIAQQHYYHSVTLQPGQAVLILGKTFHRVMPILSGVRYTLVVWIHGPNRYKRTEPYAAHEQMSAQQRWRRSPSHSESSGKQQQQQ